MTALSADPICREHLMGRAHAERPERFRFSPRLHVDLYGNQRGV